MLTLAVSIQFMNVTFVQMGREKDESRPTTIVLRLRIASCRKNGGTEVIFRLLHCIALHGK